MGKRNIALETSEREEFVKVLILAAELYSKEISNTLVKLYWHALQLYPLQDVARAFKMHFQDPDNGQFMPKPADIVRVIKGNSQTQSMVAWSKVEQAIRLVGPYPSVVFDDPIIHIVLHEMGGWVKLCQTSQKEFPFVNREFQTRYISFRYKTPSNYPAKLTGLTEHQNTMQGYQSEDPFLLGDMTKAKAVLEKGVSQASCTRVGQLLQQALPSKSNTMEGADAGTKEITSQTESHHG